MHCFHPSESAVRHVAEASTPCDVPCKQLLGGCKCSISAVQSHPPDYVCCYCADSRQRQRFGDRPHRRWPHTGHDKPSLLEEVQQLRSSGEAAAFLAEKWRRLVVRTDNFLGRKLYEYFNWRQDTSKDLVVTFGVFSTLVLAAGLLRRWGVDNQADRAGANLWADIYQVQAPARTFMDGHS